jgi:hypothetical protein
MCDSGRERTMHAPKAIYSAIIIRDDSAPRSARHARGGLWTSS